MNGLQKYLQVIKISWESGFVYRLNFIMWRLRNVIQLLTIYFLWFAVSANQKTVFSYAHAEILTYVIGTSLLRAIIFSSRSIDAQGEIATGDLNNYLVKPVNYFLYWGARDVSDKLLNIAFSIGELFLLYLWLRPVIVFQHNPQLILLSLLVIVLATTMYFMFSFIISLTTFWYYEFNGWAQRFLSLVIIETLAGGLFPLDLLPGIFGKLVTSLPTAYFIYFPLQVYLGRISTDEILQGMALMVIWIIAFSTMIRLIWNRGLKIYGAFGR